MSATDVTMVMLAKAAAMGTLSLACVLDGSYQPQGGSLTLPANLHVSLQDYDDVIELVHLHAPEVHQTLISDHVVETTWAAGARDNPNCLAKVITYYAAIRSNSIKLLIELAAAKREAKAVLPTIGNGEADSICRRDISYAGPHDRIYGVHMDRHLLRDELVRLVHTYDRMMDASPRDLPGALYQGIDAAELFLQALKLDLGMSFQQTCDGGLN